MKRGKKQLITSNHFWLGKWIWNGWIQTYQLWKFASPIDRKYLKIAFKSKNMWSARLHPKLQTHRTTWQTTLFTVRCYYRLSNIYKTSKSLPLQLRIENPECTQRNECWRRWRKENEWYNDLRAALSTTRHTISTAPYFNGQSKHITFFPAQNYHETLSSLHFWSLMTHEILFGTN